MVHRNGVEETKAEEEEAVKEMTLDEWKKLERENAKKSQPKFNLRKPGEGEDTAQWKKTYLLEKKKEEEPTEEYEEITYEVCVNTCWFELGPLLPDIFESKAGCVMSL